MNHNHVYASPDLFVLETLYSNLNPFFYCSASVFGCRCFASKASYTLCWSKYSFP